MSAKSEAYSREVAEIMGMKEMQKFPKDLTPLPETLYSDLKLEKEDDRE